LRSDAQCLVVGDKGSGCGAWLGFGVLLFIGLLVCAIALVATTSSWLLAGLLALIGLSFVYSGVAYLRAPSQQYQFERASGELLFTRHYLYRRSAVTQRYPLTDVDAVLLHETIVSRKGARHYHYGVRLRLRSGETLIVSEREAKDEAGSLAEVIAQCLSLQTTPEPAA
jgi:hypothetical protein